jgi:hypothetical protein
VGALGGQIARLGADYGLLVELRLVKCLAVCRFLRIASGIRVIQFVSVALEKNDFLLTVATPPGVLVQAVSSKIFRALKPCDDDFEGKASYLEVSA